MHARSVHDTVVTRSGAGRLELAEHASNVAAITVACIALRCDERYDTCLE